MKKNIGIVFIILYIALATFVIMCISDSTRLDCGKYGVFIDMKSAFDGLINIEYNYPKAPASTIFSYIFKNIIIFGIGNFISSLIFGGILQVKSLKDFATKKVLLIMTTIPVIILLAQLIIMIPKYKLMHSI